MHVVSFVRAKQAALIALLSEKTFADQRIADNARAAEKAHAALEQRLKTTADALMMAEERFRTLELHCHGVDDGGEQKRSTESTELSSSASAAILTSDRARVVTFSENSSPLPTIPEEIHQSRYPTETSTLREEAKTEGRGVLQTSSTAPAILETDRARTATDTTLSEVSSSLLPTIPEERYQYRGATDTTLPGEAKAEGRTEEISASASPAVLESDRAIATTDATHSKKLSPFSTASEELLQTRDNTDKTTSLEELKVGGRKEDPSTKDAILAINHARASTDTTHSEQTPSPLLAYHEETPQFRYRTENPTLLERDEAKAEGHEELPSSSAATATLENDRARAATAITNSQKSPPHVAIPDESHQLRDSTDETTLLLEVAKAEVETLRAELGRAQEAGRVAVDAARKERGAAQQRVADVEIAIEEAERERDKARSIADERLEKLGEALEQEEREGGVQVIKKKFFGLSAVYLCDINVVTENGRSLHKNAFAELMERSESECEKARSLAEDG